MLDRQDGPTILVGHSWGGTVITEAGVHDKVAGLVYVSALIPDAAFLRDAQVPVNMAVFSAPVTHAAWRDKPSWAVIATDDRAFDQAMLPHMAARAGAAITNVPASHARYFTRPHAVAEVIATAARSAALSTSA